MKWVFIKTSLVILCATFISLLSSFSAAFAIGLATCGTISLSDTYVLQNDVSSSGTCFNITADNVTLDLNGHTVTYDNGSLITVPNGSFESALSGTWDLTNAPNAARVAGTYINPPSLYDGTYAIKITTPTPDQMIQTVDTVTLQPNTTYSLSGMVYNTLSDNITIAIELSGTNAVKSQLGRTWRGFQYISATYTTGGTTETHKINLKVSGASGVATGAVYIDDIKIQRTKVYGVVTGTQGWWLLKPSDVTVYGTANNSVIKNGKIVQGSGLGDYSHAIAIGPQSATFDINNIEFTVAGANSKVLVMNSTVNAAIHHNTINHNTKTITSRDNYDGATIWANYPGYNTKIYNNTFASGVQIAIALPQSIAGQLPNEIYSNNIALQTRYTNDFAIVAPGSLWHDNTVNCGSGNNSCRGLRINGQNTKVYNNNVSVQELPRNQEYNGCSMGGAYGIQVEDATNNIEVYGNTITANAVECEAYAFRANPPIATASNNLVHDNIFIANASGDKRASTIKYSQMNDSAINFYNNILRTNHRWIYLSGEGSVTNPTFTNNRWETTGTLPSQFHPFEVYTWGDTHFTGTFLNNIYGSGDQSRFESEFFRTQGAMPPDPLSNYFISWHLTLNTINQSGQFLSDVSVHINDVNGLQVFSGNTDIQGKLVIPLPEFKDVAGTKSYYNPFTITATRLNQTLTNTVTMDSPRTISFTFDTTPPQITATPAGGPFGTPQSVTLSSNEPATIYYTLDGADPTIVSTVYSGAIAISSTKTLKFFGRDSAGNDSAVQTINYVIDQLSPIVTASPNGGTFKSQANVTLSADEPASIFYTTDGTEPTVNSNVYTQALLISTNTTIKFIGKDVVGNISAVQTATFKIDLTPPTVTAFTIPSITNSFTVPITSFDANDTGNAVTGYYCLTTSTTSDGCTWETTKPTSYPVSADGSYTLYPWAKDAAGNRSLLFGAPRGIVVDTTKPTVDSFTIPSLSSSLTVPISAFTASDIGSHVTGYLVTEDSNPPAVGSGGWTASAQMSYTFTTAGKKILYAWAKDAAGNVSASLNSSLTISLTVPVTGASGDLNGDGLVDIRDAQLALQIAVGLINPSPADMNAGDVAPLINGKPAPDGKIDIGDAVLILQKAITLVNW